MCPFCDDRIREMPRGLWKSVLGGLRLHYCRGYTADLTPPTAESRPWYARFCEGCESVKRREVELIREMMARSCEICALVVGTEEEVHEVLGVCCGRCRRGCGQDGGESGSLKEVMPPPYSEKASSTGGTSM